MGKIADKKLEEATRVNQIQSQILTRNIETVGRLLNYTDKNWGITDKCWHERRKEKEQMLQNRISEDKFKNLDIPIPFESLSYWRNQAEICHGEEFLFHGTVELKNNHSFNEILQQALTEGEGGIDGTEKVARNTSRELILVKPDRQNSSANNSKETKDAEVQMSVRKEFYNSEDESEEGDKENISWNIPQKDPSPSPSKSQSPESEEHKNTSPVASKNSLKKVLHPYNLYRPLRKQRRKGLGQNLENLVQKPTKGKR